MRVLRIVARGFMSYADLDLDLSELHTAAIVGENGAGKSSLIEAITFALWGETTREDPIYDNAEECTVQVDFRARGEVYSVVRSINRSGRDSSLTLRTAGDAAEDPQLRRQHTIKETQAKIDQLVGLTYDSITAGPLMLQGQGSPLMDLPPKDRKNLLIQLFGVERYEAYHQSALQQASDYGREAEAFEKQVADLDVVVADEAVATAALTNARYDLVVALQERDKTNAALSEAREKQIAMREQTRHLETLRDTVEMLKQRIATDAAEQQRVLRQISDAHQSLTQAAPTFDGDLNEVDAEWLAQAGAEVDEAQRASDERRGIEGKIPVLQAALDRSEKMASIVDTVPCGGQGIYAACRFLTSAPKADDLAAQRDEIASLESQLAGLGSDARLRELREAVAEALGAERQQADERLRRQTLVAQWEVRQEAAQQTLANGQDQLLRLETQAKRDEMQLARSLEQLESMVKPDEDPITVDAQVSSLAAQAEEQSRSIEMVYQPAVQSAEASVATIEGAKAKRIEMNRMAKEARGKADVYALVAKAFHRDGIPTLIIENGLPLIEERANEILARMPGAYRIRILTQRENKKGGMMDRVSIVVERGGRPRAYRNLSGGQQFRVNFALRVAIGRALAQRSGATVDTLMLDEGWGTQDKQGIEALLESIAAVQSDFDLILIVTHQESVIERFQTRLEAVLHDDDYSTIHLAA